MKNLKELREDLDKKDNELQALKQEKAQLESRFNVYSDDAEKTFQDLRQERDQGRTEAQGLESKMAELSALEKRATHHSRSVSPSQRLHTFNHSEESSRRDSTASTLASTNPLNIRPVNQHQTPQEKQPPIIRHVDRGTSPMVTTRKSTL